MKFIKFYIDLLARQCFISLRGLETSLVVYALLLPVLEYHETLIIDEI